MALFSDIDWLILLGAGAFLLFGQKNGEMLRTLGRWYGRAGRIKQELLGELTRAADIPAPAPGVPLTIRGALLGLDPPENALRGIPHAVPRPTPPTEPPFPTPTWPSWSVAYPTVTWSSTSSLRPSEPEAPP